VSCIEQHVAKETAEY